MDDKYTIKVELPAKHILTPWLHGHIPDEDMIGKKFKYEDKVIGIIKDAKDGLLYIEVTDQELFDEATKPKHTSMEVVLNSKGE